MTTTISYTFLVVLVGGRHRHVTMHATGPNHARWKAEEKLKAAGFRWTTLTLQPPATRVA